MTTETGNGEESGKPQTSGQVKIEWNWDLDDERQKRNASIATPSMFRATTILSGELPAWLPMRRPARRPRSSRQRWPNTGRGREPGLA